MAVTVEIDQKSGFCGGVIRAIGKAEEFLDSGREGTLYSLGAIVHNEAELARLGSKGLVAIDKDGLKDAAGRTVLIRAHGEPPQTYEKARSARPMPAFTAALLTVSSLYSERLDMPRSLAWSVRLTAMPS